MKRFKRVISSILVVIMMLSTIVSVTPIMSSAAAPFPSDIYIAQQTSYTCTLASATMMIRARFYLSGNSLWSSITESKVQSVGWGSSLKWAFTYSLDGNSCTIAHDTYSGISLSQIRSILASHPEGFVLYCGGGDSPHAVFITDVEGDTIYCCDPDYNEYQRTPLSSSWLGKKYGSQSSVLSKTTATWYVKSYSISNNHTCNLSGGYKYFLQSHPHHNCYACSICGAVNADTSSSNYYDSCDICVGYPAKPTLTVYSGSSTEDIMFLSSVAERASSYDFKIKDPVTGEVLYAIYGQPRLCSMKLPEGNYCVTVAGINDSLANTDRWWGEWSELVFFTVTEGSLEVANSVEYNGHRYELYLNRLSWQNAKAKCEELGGHLATITSAEEQEIVSTISQGKGLFIGATNLDGNWEWITGEEFNYSNWADGEPNDTGNLSENYLGLTTNNEWNDFDFINQDAIGFICEYECEHSEYIESVITEATCMNEGIKNIICNNCGYTYSETIPVTAHSWGEWICDKTGSDTDIMSLIRYCANCNESENQKAEGYCGENLSWKLNNSGELYISGIGAMNNYEYDTIPWLLYKNEIKSILISDGVTNIGNYAFSNLPALVDVSMPDSVTIIGSNAFRNNDSLKVVSLPQSLLVIDREAFYSCESLESIIFPETITTIEYFAFGRCFALKNVRIPASVSSIGQLAFYGCTALKEIVVDENNDYYSSVDGVLYNKDVSVLLQYPSGKENEKYDIPNTVSEIRFYSIENNSILKDINIPDSVKTIGQSNFSGCTSIESIIIPDSVTVMGSSIFGECTSLKTVVLGDSITSIGAWAYENCTSLESITIPDSVIEIHYTSFYNVNRNILTIKCYENSVAHTYAVERNIKVELMHNCEFNNYIDNNDATCLENGTKTAKCEYCDATDTIVIEGSALGHSWSDWIVIKETTTTSEGEQLRYCKTCKANETERIPMLEEEEKIVPELSVNNYTIMLNNAELLSHIRYASGKYETAGEIKNASDCVDLSSSVITKNTADGIFSYEMANGGIYSLWIKLTDGTTYILTADLTVMEQEVDVYGVTVTLKNLYGVKDYFIAKGEHTTYSEVKANSVVQITQNKIQGAHNYKYILSKPGTYTICVRYDDPTREHEFITFEVTVTEPTFTGNGLQLTVGNLDDIKVIRTAYGEYNTPGDVKRAEGARAFTAKTVLKGLDEYTVQYRENGVVTVAVVYNNGYEVMYTYEVTKKVPNFISSGKTVIIGDLDGLNLVRYAKGEYATSNQIKNAPGSKVVKSDSIVGGYIILELDAGTYTFCVQYDDESYNYYVVTIE